MHGNILNVLFLVHNTLLILISIAYWTVLMLFWRDNGALGQVYTDAERQGIVWPNTAAVIIALVNTVNGYVAYKREMLVGFYVYMTLGALSACAPLPLAKLIRIDDLMRGTTAEEAKTLVNLVNAFACAFFGSNFICFYNAFTMQYALRTKKKRAANLERAMKRTSPIVDGKRQLAEAAIETEDTRDNIVDGKRQLAEADIETKDTRDNAVT